MSDGLPTELIEPLSPPAAPAVPVFPASLNGTLRSERRNKSAKRSVSPKPPSTAVATPKPASPVPPSVQIKDSTDTNHNAVHPCIQQAPAVPDLISSQGLGLLSINLTFHYFCTLHCTSILFY